MWCGVTLHLLYPVVLDETYKCSVQHCFSGFSNCVALWMAVCVGSIVLQTTVAVHTTVGCHTPETLNRIFWPLFSVIQ